jgi:pimeloyl-ACP methyl ester carboxylesterase
MNRIYFLILISFFTSTGFGQNITGNWEGTLKVQGTEIPIVFHISKDSTGKFSASFDSPKQNAYNLACSEVIIKNDSVIIMMQIIKGWYSGKTDERNQMMTGTWVQGGAALPLNLGKTSKTVKTKEINHPQTPKPPFPYKSEDVEYDNADKSIHFGATFTVPLPDPNVNYLIAPTYPVVVLITGSGKQDRDETIFGHKPFAVIADYLTRHGIAVLRIDDRDMGKTTGDFSKSTTADFANDVEAGINYLKSRKEIDSNNIGLIGHSEGGMIAPMVAAKRKDVKFIVLLAGPGVKISELMEQQSVDIASSRGIPDKKLAQYRILYRQLVSIIINEPDSEKVFTRAVAVFNGWQKDNDNSTVRITTGVSDEETKLAFIRSFIEQLSSPWFNYFIKFDPARYLQKINCPVLALNGEKDIQVSSKQNLAAIKMSLEKNKNKKFKTLEMAGLNHLFQHCKKCSAEEYGELEESFDTATLNIIADWINIDRFQ